MYQVIKMFGDWEPWWFLDDWQDDIIEEQTFEYFEEAVSFYKSEWQSLRMNLPICKLLSGIKPRNVGVKIVVIICSNIILF